MKETKITLPKLFATTLSFIFFMGWIFSIPLPDADASSKNLEYVGTPYTSQYPGGEDIYSRNIWDMQVFDGILYIGAGNSSNKGPSVNSGPLHMYGYNLSSEVFIPAVKIRDEQVDVFRVFGKTLYIPGHDATQNWDFGNYYSKHSNKEWQMHRTIPGGLHVYDLVEFDTNIFVALGTVQGAAVGISSDGEKWKIHPLGKGRVYSFLTIGKRLFAVKSFKNTLQPHLSMAEYKNEKFVPKDNLTIHALFPDTTFNQKPVKLTRPVNLGTSVLYIGAYSHNDHQSIPIGLYHATFKDNHLKAQKISLNKDEYPRDILHRNKVFYILATAKKSGGLTTNRVYTGSVDSPSQLQLLFEFDYRSFARSFEECDGDFYFGIGSEIKDEKKWNLRELNVKTGDIIRIRKNSY